MMTMPSAALKPVLRPAVGRAFGDGGAVETSYDVDEVVDDAVIEGAVVVDTDSEEHKPR